MTIKEVQKLAKKLELLDYAYESVGDEWSSYPYIRDLLRDKIIQERAWLVETVNGQTIEVEL